MPDSCRVSCAPQNLAEVDRHGISDGINRCVRRHLLCGTGAVTRLSDEPRGQHPQEQISFLSALKELDVPEHRVMPSRPNLIACDRPELVEQSLSEESSGGRTAFAFPG